jgi:phage terminase large subunit-like protein
MSHSLASALADGGWRARARPSQLPPPGDWNGWGLLGGRGLGKTWVGANYYQRDGADGQPHRLDRRHERRIEWPNGAIATAFSAEESERLRGPQFSFLWADELCAWQNSQAVWDQAMFGLRIGDHPRWLFTSTPKPITLLRELLARDGKDVVITRGSTFENSANLAPAFLAAIQARYAGTRLGRQELEAELLSDVPGALWQLDWLDRDRVERGPELKRIVVAIDPAVSTTKAATRRELLLPASMRINTVTFWKTCPVDRRRTNGPQRL